MTKCATCGKRCDIKTGILTVGDKSYHYPCWKTTPTALYMRRGVLIEEIAKRQNELYQIESAIMSFELEEKRRAEDKEKALVSKKFKAREEAENSQRKAVK